MKLTQQAAISLLKSFFKEVGNLFHLLRTKGLKAYQRPLFLAGLILFASYYAGYRLPASILDLAHAEILGNKRKIKFAERYRDLNWEIKGFMASLPKPRGEDRDRWMAETVKAVMKQKEEGIVLSSLNYEKRVTNASAASGFSIVSISIACRGGYSDLYKWIRRLEHSNYSIQIIHLKLEKDNTELGSNKVDLMLRSAFLSTEGGAT